MFSHFGNIDLAFLFQNEESLSGFASKVVAQARVIGGYTRPYLYSSIGCPEFEILVDFDEKNKEASLASMETHVSGNCVWEMAAALDITPPDDEYGKVVIFRDKETGAGLVPVELRFHDVLPSILTDDVVKMQVVAFPEAVELFKTEEEYFAFISEENSDEALRVGQGTIIPGGMINNRMNKEDHEKIDLREDMIVTFHAPIKRIEQGSMENWWRADDEEMSEYHTFDYVTVDTSCGELEIILGLSQTTDKQKELLEEGSIIAVVGTLSGDVLVDDFEGGAFYNTENDLRLIRQWYDDKQSIRLFSMLNNDAVLEAPFLNEKISGRQNVIDRMTEYLDSKEKTLTAMATASVIFDDESVDLSSSRRCVAVSYGGQFAENLVFVETDESGKVDKIRIVSALGFDVKIDRLPYFDYIADEVYDGEYEN